MAFLLDRLDVELLNLVQADSQLTSSGLSEKVALSPSAALRRLHKLRETGVIARESAVVSDEFLKTRVSGLVLVQMNRHSPEVVMALKRQLSERPEVQLMFEITGSFDMMLLIVERDMAAFLALTDKVLGASPYVARFEISFVKSRIKSTLAVPVDLRDANR